MHHQYKNPCITLHQPWASLLVYGIKRVEGRSWPAPINVLSGRLWIHAAAKVPEPATIEAMENFYREIYKVDGVTDLKFPEHYPVSVLIGSVKVVGCVKQEELVSWEDLPEGVRLEGQTDFCWLCEDPQRLVVPFEMRGWQGVYNLEKKIAADAVRALRRVKVPAPVKFPLPDPSDPSSLRPGVLHATFCKARGSPSNLPNSSSLNTSIAGARAAASQFRKREQPERQHPLNRSLQNPGSLGDCSGQARGSPSIHSISASLNASIVGPRAAASEVRESQQPERQYPMDPSSGKPRGPIAGASAAASQFRKSEHLERHYPVGPSSWKPRGVGAASDQVRGSPSSLPISSSLNTSIVGTSAAGSQSRKREHPTRQ